MSSDVKSNMLAISNRSNSNHLDVEAIWMWFCWCSAISNRVFFLQLQVVAIAILQFGHVRFSSNGFQHGTLVLQGWPLCRQSYPLRHMTFSENEFVLKTTLLKHLLSNSWWHVCGLQVTERIWVSTRIMPHDVSKQFCVITSSLTSNFSLALSITCFHSQTSGESNRPLSPIHAKRYRDTPPISMAYFCKSMPSLWQKVVYTPPICITIRLPFVSRYFCGSIRVRGRWGHSQKLITNERVCLVTSRFFTAVTAMRS